MKNTAGAHLAIIGTNIIYGITYTVAKDVMPGYIPPFAFIAIRIIGAALLFSSIFLFKYEKIERKDLLKLFLCSILGVATNQLFFFKGLEMSTPINAGIIMTLSPVMVLSVGAIIGREKVTKLKVAGIILGLAGALTLIIGSSTGASFNSDHMLGNLYIFINALSYSMYLITVKPLMKKYNPITVVTYMFVLGIFIVTPISFNQLTTIDWTSFTPIIWFKTAFIVVCATFLTYLFIIYALSKVSPTVVSTYIYSQPIVAAIYAISLQKDHIDLIKIVATILIFLGVYFVSRQNKSKFVPQLKTSK